jgi:peptidoglycan/xylan/chitin deacetylase (PgdA/CDA1 family)
MRLAAVSVDLDEIPCYAAIHGLPPPAEECAHAVYRNCVPRFEALLDDLHLRATFFAIGADLDDTVARAAIARLHGAGHEIGNHTLHHRYDFTRMPAPELRAEIDGGARAIENVTGSRPVGFRAPGYTITDAVFAELSALGVGYDSSVFPCPSYYAAKSVAISAIALRRRRSHSIVDHPRVLRAPADPYRTGTPYYRRGSGLLELPIGVTRDATARLPYIGTYVVLGGAGGAAWLTRRIIGRPLVNLELHGISLEHKRRALESAIWVLRGAGYEFVTLAQAAEHFGAQ